MCVIGATVTIHPLMMHLLVWQLLTIVSDQTYCKTKCSPNKSKRLRHFYAKRKSNIKWLQRCQSKRKISCSLYIFRFNELSFSFRCTCWHQVKFSCSVISPLAGLNDFNEMKITNRDFSFSRWICSNKLKRFSAFFESYKK